MRKVLISGMIGNGFEWYDFALYGHMAFILSRLFFPNDDATLQLLATYSAFAVGFIFRPLGAVFFGWMGDKFGRKRALVTAILMMAIPTGCIGLLPTYSQIGVLAPVLLVIIRMLQGLSLGGEFGGAITYVVEHAPPDKRGLIGVSTVVSLVVGFMMGSGVAMLTITVLTPEQFESFGWRLPFLFGVVIGLIGFYIRTHCAESPAYLEAKANHAISSTPLRDVFAHHPITMLRAFGAYTAVTMPFYLVAIFFIAYSEKYLGLTTTEALIINTLAMGCMLVGMFIGAVASDAYGRRVWMIVAASLMLCVSAPLMWWMGNSAFIGVLIAQALFGFVVGLYVGPIPALLVEMFPTTVRYTGMSLAFNAATVVFGGTAPTVCIALLAWVNSPLVIAAYVMLCCCIALWALWGYKDTSV